VLLALLLVRSFPSSPGECCKAPTPAPEASAMSCCASEQTLQCPQCPASDNGSTVGAALTISNGSDAGAPAVERVVGSVSPEIRCAAQTDRASHAEGPPLYRLHAQLLI
jgi:hypothetical protein